MCKLIDITGKKYNKLTVLKYLSGGKWECLCDCGNYTKVRRGDLERNHTKSCGCLGLKNAKSHGLRYSKEYNSWRGMKDRCLNSSNLYYKHYGGRGIKVCDRWLESFENFYEDMGNKPSSSHSIERIDNNGPYNSENCIWATKKEQSTNRRNSLIITEGGKTQTLSAWAKELGENYGTLKSRFYRSGSIIKK